MLAQHLAFNHEHVCASALYLALYKMLD